MSFCSQNEGNSPKILLKIFFSLSNFKFGLFPGSFTFILKLILCGLRNLRKKDDDYNSFLSGCTSHFYTEMVTFGMDLVTR